jgi:diaminopimelate decarboxylase
VTPIRFPQHAPIDAFGVVGEELAIGGVPIGRLAERVGRTPFYAYDRSVMSARVARLRSILPRDLHLHYAIKANPMPAVVQHLGRLVDGLDVASAGEMAVALDSGAEAARVSFAGPGKSAHEIRQAVAAGVVTTVESPRQFRQALEAGDALGVRPRIAIRVNPSFELKAAGMKMGGGPKPFGVDEPLALAMLDDARAAGVALSGFHVFAGSQNLRPAAIVEAQSKSFELGVRLAAAWGGPVDWLNIGGGFGVPYFPGDEELDLEPVAANLDALCRGARDALGAPLVLELGRYLVATAGVYVCRVIDRKDSCGRTFLVTDGGLHHHLAASGNFGQVLRKNYPVAIANRMGAPLEDAQTVVGPLCTPLDLLADRMQLARAEVGDLVAVFQSGAYGLTASPTAFLGHPAPAEVLV